MPDDAWTQEANPTTVPGVTRRQVYDLVYKLATDGERYRLYRRAEAVHDRKGYLEDLLEEDGINVPGKLLRDFSLPTQEDLREYLEEFERSPERWVGIPRDPIHCAFSTCCFRGGP